MRVLVVDDDEITLELLKYTLEQSGYEVHCARDGREAVAMLRTGRFRLVISDWEMPELSGLELCRHVRSRHFGEYVYIILVTARHTTADIVEGLEAGADDFITKPFQPTELCVRVRVGERLLALETRNVTIFALAKLADSRDPETGAHLERIREYSRIIAQQLSEEGQYRNEVDGEYVDAIYLTSPLHDIGKVGIPDAVLRKPGPLSEREYEIMKRHTIIGAETLGAALRHYPEARILRMAHDIALTHHERYDGSGYPRGLAADQIPLCGRIVALADVYDALTTDRIYKPAYPHEIARSMIVEASGVHFDPDVVDAFLASEALFIAVQQNFAEALADQKKPLDSLEFANVAY